MSTSVADPRKERLAVLFATAIVGVLHVAGFAEVRLDDAYITYRYGENIARGRGFVFNPGEHILGTTSPGQALLAALAHTVAGHTALPTVMSAVGALSWTAQAWLVYAIARRSLDTTAAMLVSLCVAAGAARSYLFVPIETNIVAAAVLAAALLALSRRWSAAALLLGVATLLRGDAALMGLPLLVLAVRDLGGRAVRPVVASALLPVAWEVFAYGYFGTLFPHTLVAKAHASSVARYAEHVARLPLETLLPHAHVGTTIGLVAWCVAGLGWVFAIRRDERVAVLPAWGALHLAVYTFILRPRPGNTWHLYPGSLIAILGLLYALAWAIERAQATWLKASAIALVTAFASWNAIVFSVQYPVLFWYGARDANDRNIAAYLRERAQPSDVVDAEEVGTLAYYSDLPMIDHPGLVTGDDLAAPPGPDQVEHHCRALMALAGLRFLVMSRGEIPPHACLVGTRPITLFERRALDGGWRLWVADRGAI